VVFLQSVKAHGDLEFTLKIIKSWQIQWSVKSGTVCA